MDANGLRFWMLSESSHWKNLVRTQYDSERRSLRLRSSRSLRTVVEMGDLTGLEGVAIARLEIVPQARDAFNTRARWDAASRSIKAAGAMPGEATIWLAPLGRTVTDLAMGFDGALYIALDDGDIVMQDRRGRWEPFTVHHDDFKAWRIAADPGGGVWAIDKKGKLAKLKGMPFPSRPLSSYSPETFRPCEENPDPPRLVIIPQAGWAPEVTVAVACSLEGRVAILTWAQVGGAGKVYVLEPDGWWARPVELKGTHFPYSLSWAGNDLVAALLPNIDNEAPVFQIEKQKPDSKVEPIDPTGDFYPLNDFVPGPFAHTLSLPPYYPVKIEQAADQPQESGIPDAAPLYHLSLPAFAREGSASTSDLANSEFRPFDSGSGQTVWHRLYVEADIPPNCGITVLLAATDALRPPDEKDPNLWHKHYFGELFAHAGGEPVPRGAWVRSASEIPFHTGLLHCERKKNRTGLFTALIQRSTRQVRALRGRYLHVIVKLEGDERSSPELAAVRAYASRFSYLNQYLPEAYRETLFGDDADEIMPKGAPSTGPDFLERFLDNFEGVLTPLEDRIAGAWLLTDPRAVPSDALDWLGSWIGAAFDSAYPAQRRRLMLENAPALFRKRATLGGLRLALDIATGGAVTGGEILVIEDFRLRRTFATILGADLADENDPLLSGLAVSGNSFVGDTLFLGDEQKKEFLALFSANLSLTDSEEEAVRALFDRLANRVTVLVHQEVEPQDLGLIRRVVDLEKPAHVEAKVLTASGPLMVGLASLVGVDTYLSPKSKPDPVRVEKSRIGVRDLIRRPPSLDPRLEGGATAQMQRPRARLQGNPEATFGESFILDGSESRAGEGHEISRYTWMLKESEDP